MDADLAQEVSEFIDGSEVKFDSGQVIDCAHIIPVRTCKFMFCSVTFTDYGADKFSKRFDLLRA